MNETVYAKPTPEYLEKSKTRVRVFTPSGVVEGDYSHAPGVRLSDSLRNAATGERYILLTDVTVRPQDGQQQDSPSDAFPFVLLSTAHASLLIPLGEE